jgi:hypothetical protein
MADLPQNAVFEANLRALARTEPALVERLRAVEPADVTWLDSKAGPLSATINHNGRSLALASKYDPAAEAAKLNEAVDFAKHAAVVVLGMGIGHHVIELAKKARLDVVLVIFEPNLALLRAVLERVDHTSWLGRPTIFLADTALDRGGLVARLEKFAGVITQGTVIVTHPPARQMWPAEVNQFSQMVTDALAFCRTNVATSLVNAARTVSNLTMNVGWYAAGNNTNELFNAAKGYPAICVGAGPSLARNVDLLRDPAVRKNVVIITAQTTLKPLLQRGIRPDFVTALDYSEISKRFYEGLPDLPDVTLVAEAKAHPTVLNNFPGPVRVTNNAFLDRFIGDMQRPIIPIRAGATVAHLSLYLAQHLGCDPIMMIGQDLGFSDGLYYCPGTAIHEVWEPELNAFNSLEMMEWTRIVRHRGNLDRQTDVHGQSIYTDEQMLTYLKQFERDFAQAKQLIIDATEGGLPKADTQPMTLEAALEQYATRPVPKLPLAARGVDPARLAQVAELVDHRIEDTKQLRFATQQTIPIIGRMIEHQSDERKMHRLFDEMEKHKKRAEELHEVFELVNHLNTVGAFRRARADRAIEHATGTEFEIQTKRLQRDMENLDWLKQSCDEAISTYELARAEVRRLKQSQSRRPAEVAG